MRVVITGSHGFIGSELASTLRRAGHEVTPVVRSSPAGSSEATSRAPAPVATGRTRER